jgi:hypothetical protein
MGGWHFLSLPKKQSHIIKNVFSDMHRGWGSIPVTVTVGITTWDTSIFRDSKKDCYLLPLKSEVRKKEKIEDGDTISFLIEINA